MYCSPWVRKELDMTEQLNRSEEHTSELQSHSDISYAVFCFASVQFSSVAQSCLSLCDPMDCSMPDFPVHHQHPELA